MSEARAFHLAGITLDFHGARLFDRLDLEIARGETVGILGPSGSGKSTLLKLMAGLISPTAGTIEMFGRPLKELEREDRPAFRRRVQMTFQKSGLFDSRTCRDNLEFTLRELLPLGPAAREQKISQVLGDVGLLGHQDLLPSQMSGGMQKRLGIARALVLSPEVVLYDDPTAGLDPITSRTILTLVEEMREKYEMTVVLVTSDPAQASRLCDRIGFLYEGKIQEIAEPAAMKHSRNPAVKQFMHGLLEGPLTVGRTSL